MEGAISVPAEEEEREVELYFLCHARGPSFQLDSSLVRLVAGRFHAELSGELTERAG